MKSTYITNLVLILLVIGLYWFNSQDHTPTSDITKLTTIASNDIHKITVSRPNADTIVVEKDTSDWQLIQPLQAKANNTRIELLLSLLNTPSYSQLPHSHDEPLSPFGLAPASVMVTFDNNIIKFGALETISNHRYVLHNNIIHLINDQISPLLNSQAASFIDNRLIASGNIITKLSLPIYIVDNNLSNDYAVIENIDGHWQSTLDGSTADQLTKLVDAWQHAYALQVLPLQVTQNTTPTTKIQIWFQHQAEPIELMIQVNEHSLFIINPLLQLKYQFPMTRLQHLLPSHSTHPNAPELPEVETTRLGILPYIKGAKITQVIIRQFSLRWPIDKELAGILIGQTVHKISRRAKYLLFKCDSGTLIIHLGMSGKLRILDNTDTTGIDKHDHVDITLSNDHLLRYNDPRRFGAILWTTDPIGQHLLLKHLGSEPLTKLFTATYLWQHSRSRRCSVKTLIMNGKIVVGVGNIYANEALFMSGIHPKMSSNRLTPDNCKRLVTSIKTVLKHAIKAGGTTLKDFRKTDGKPGYFAQQLNVYGRKNEACYHCGSMIRHYKETQRATFYCPLCQQ